MRTWLDSICLWNLVSLWLIGICRAGPQADTTGLYWCRWAINQAFISDIAGFDPRMHDGSVPGIVTTVMAWLATRPDTIRTPN